MFLLGVSCCPISRNGTERLNDIHILDTETSNWTCPHVGGVLPHPRAGMTLTALRGRLYLFGGSGTSAKCFQDLQILDRQEMAWLDVTPYEAGGNGCSSSTGGLHCSTQADEADMANRFAFGPSTPTTSWNRYDESGCGPNSPRNSSDGRFMGDYLMDEPEQQRSPQQGGDFATATRRTFSGSRSSDWRSRDMGNTMRRQYQSPNPNDEDTVPAVLVQGRGPGRRAGHTATAVNRKIYIFGGSCGSDYLNDFWYVPFCGLLVCVALFAHLAVPFCSFAGCWIRIHLRMRLCANLIAYSSLSVVCATSSTTKNFLTSHLWFKARRYTATRWSSLLYQTASVQCSRPDSASQRLWKLRYRIAAMLRSWRLWNTFIQVFCQNH